MPCHLDSLETRLALSGTSAIIMDSATTADSKGVTIDYDVPSQAAGMPLSFGVFRSTDASFSPDDIGVGSETVVGSGRTTPLLDDKGVAASAEGRHQLTIPLPDGLPLNPKHPYVVVVANPDSTPAGMTPPSASFRKFTIGVITHGGIEDTSWKNGPMWELVMAHSLKLEGYDAVIPYNWVAKSSTPGEAAKQGPKLANDVLKLANQAPPNEPIDIQFIGHSEGTTVNTIAIRQLEKTITPAISEGYLQETLLDPHAANNLFTGKQVSTAGILGGAANAILHIYQAEAKDPLPAVPSGVDQADVFYQHSPAESSDIYNIWGQVPVKGPSSYFNLTAGKVTHSGKTGIAAWYQNNIVPTLGDGAPGLKAQTLQGRLDRVGLSSSEAKGSVDVHEPRYVGKAGPDVEVRLYAGPANHPSSLKLVGKTTADSNGAWSVTTKPLTDGRYRVMAVSFPQRSQTPPYSIMNPTEPLGLLVVQTNPRD